MKTIKFRAWDIDSSEMFYTDKDNHSQDFFFSFTEGNLDLFMSVEDDYPENRKAEIMQFTGIKDELQKEIWEGDILEFPFEMGIAYVINDGFRFAVKSPGSEAVDYEGESVLKLTRVIGNIYENPELLTVPTAVL